MSNGPSEEGQSTAKKRKSRIWATTGLTLGAIATLGVAGAAWWAWIFINERLSPWLSEVLTEVIERPVILGEVERVSLTGIQFGPSAVPPTADDPDEVYIERIDIRFNPLQLLRRRLTPQINLVGIQGYIEQSENGQWLDVTIQLPDEDEDEDQDPLIRFSPTIGIKESEIALLPYGGEDDAPVPLVLNNINGTVSYEDVDVDDVPTAENPITASNLAVDLTAEPENIGKLSVNGIIEQLDYGDEDDDVERPVLETIDATVNITAQQIDLAAVSPAIFSTTPGGLPFSILAGKLSGDVVLELTPREAPRLTGPARIDDGAMVFDGQTIPLRDINARGQFAGNGFDFSRLTVRYGNLYTVAKGVIDTRNGYNLSGPLEPFAIAELLEVFDLEVPIPLEGTFQGPLTMTGPLDQPVITANLESTDVTTIDKVQFANLAAEITYTTKAVIVSALQAEPLAGGRLTGEGTFTFGDPAAIAVQLSGENLPADALGRPYGLPETITLGAVALDADISGALDNLTGVVNWQAPGGTYPTRGTAEIAQNVVRFRDTVVQVAGGTVAGSGTLANGQWTADLVAQGIQLGEFNAALADGTVAGTAQLAGRLDDFSPAGIRGQGDITASLRGGTLTSQVALANGLWEADVQTQNFPVGQFTRGVPIGSLTADAQLTGSLADLSPTGIQGTGTIAAAIAGGTVTGNVQLANGIFQAAGEATNLELRQLAADLQGRGDATFQLAGNLGNLSPTGIQGQANIRLSDGLATAAGINPALARSRSPLTARLAWDGRQIRVDTLETAGLTATGTITPQLIGPGAPGIAALDLALTAEDFALATLPVNFPPALGLLGEATFRGRLTGTPADLNLVGDLALTDLALNDLRFEPSLVGNVNFSSQAGLDVALRGEQDEIIVAFEPQTRQINFNVQAGEAIATGETVGDLLQVRLYTFPVSALNIPPAEASPYGSLRGEITFATAAINLDTLNTTGQINVENLGIGYYSVDRLFGGFSYLNGIAALNDGVIVMADRDSRGEAIATRSYNLEGSFGLGRTPQIAARLSTEEGQLRDIFEVLKIRELADFARGFTPEEGFIPRSQAEAEAILATTPAGDPNASLLNQFRRLSEILELEVQAELQAENATLPPLSELQGEFSGEVVLTATLPEDLNARFDIAGAGWQWGDDLKADAVTAVGSYENGLITLSPVRFSTADTAEPAFVNLAGTFSLDPEEVQEQPMMLEVVNVPIDALEDFANLPFDLDGRLNGTARLLGPLAKPELAGEFQVANGTLNGNPIEQASFALSYAAARAGLDAQLLLVGSDDPLTLTAKVPYRLGFVTEEPTDRSYVIRANVQDEGFALLNLFTDQVAWESGEGELILALEGDLEVSSLPTTFNGLILLQGATISFSALPEPMTNVTGQIRLLPTSLAVVVDRLSGQFSEGELSAQGTFPLFVPLDEMGATQSAMDEGLDLPGPDGAEPAPPIAEPAAPGDEPDGDTLPEPADTPAETPLRNPLTLAISGIDLNLKGLYNGQVNGLMAVGGSALYGPELSGEIDLSDGVITIPESGNAPPSATINDNGPSPIPPVRFEDLRIVLSRNIQIVQGALLNVSARGGLRLDGTLDNIRPTGIIRLPSGRVGLFAVSLRLAGDNDRAEFRGNFDPLLDVTLQTSLPDVPRGSGIEPTTSPFPRNEVPDNTIRNIGLTQQGNSLVRINARYTGPASELANLTTDSRNLELSSSPVRSDQEIISLLSGNVIGALDALTNGGDALAGLGTFVGSALLSSVREFLGDTVPISEFRIFQVTESSGGVNDSEDIGGEIGFDITSNISVSVLKVLTNDTPFQFNTRYRLSNQFTLRGTTSFEDFSDRTGVLLEYETRF